MTGGPPSPEVGRHPDASRLECLRPHLKSLQFGPCSSSAVRPGRDPAPWPGSGPANRPAVAAVLPRCARLAHGNASRPSARSKAGSRTRGGRGLCKPAPQSRQGVSAAQSRPDGGRPARTGNESKPSGPRPWASGGELAPSPARAVGREHTATSTAIPKRSQASGPPAPMVGKVGIAPITNRDLTGARFRCWPGVWGMAAGRPGLKRQGRKGSEDWHSPAPGARRRRSCAGSATVPLPGAGSSAGNETSAGGSVSRAGRSPACGRCSPAARLPGRHLAGELDSAQPGVDLQINRRPGPGPSRSSSPRTASLPELLELLWRDGVEAILPNPGDLRGGGPPAPGPGRAGQAPAPKHRPGRCLPARRPTMEGPFPGPTGPPRAHRARTSARPAWRRLHARRIGGFEDQQSIWSPWPAELPRRRRRDRGLLRAAGASW